MSNKVSNSNNVKPLVSGTKNTLTKTNIKLKNANMRKVKPMPNASRRVKVMLLFKNTIIEKVEHVMVVDKVFTGNGSISPIKVHDIGHNPKLYEKEKTTTLKKGIHFKNAFLMVKVMTIPIETEAIKQTTDEVIRIGRRPAFSIKKPHITVLDNLTAPINTVHMKGFRSTPDNLNK